MGRWLPKFSPAVAYSFVTGAAWGLDLTGLAAGNTRAGRALLEQFYPDQAAAEAREDSSVDVQKAA